MIKLTSLIAEVTDMIFLVAKTVEPKDKELAMKIADYLNKQGIVARAKYPARFGLTNWKETPSWGIYTTRTLEKKAQSLLKKNPQTKNGLIFDDQQQEAEVPEPQKKPWKGHEKGCRRCGSPDIHRETPPGGFGGKLCWDCYHDWQDEMR